MVSAIPLVTHTAGGIVGPSPSDVGNIWYPYGPTSGAVNRIQFTYFSDPVAEFAAFEQGKIDIVDWETDFAKWAPYDANPDFLQTPAQGTYGLFGIYFNGASSRFTASQESPTSPANGPYWGCDWNTGTPFTSSRQTYVTACGIEMREAFAHLLDRITGAAKRNLAALQCPTAAAKLPSCAPASTVPPYVSTATECSWDTMASLPSHSSCSSAFHLASSGGDWQQPVGSPDFCAAADHMIAAGIASGKAPSTCVLTGVNPGVFAHPLRFMIRTSQPRLSMGLQEMAAINMLLDGSAVTPTYGGIQQIGFPIVLSDPPVSPIDDWDAYTIGSSTPGPYPDHMLGLYGGQGASDYCGGVQVGFPDNAQLVCIPELDAASTAAETTLDLPLLPLAR